MKRYIKSAVNRIEDAGAFAQHDFAKETDSVRALVRLSKSDDTFVQCAIAGNPSTPPEVLRKFVNSPSYAVRRDLARNPSTPRDVLDMLANEELEDMVLVGLVRNPNTPKEYLEKFSTYEGKSEGYLVRLWVAKNPNTPKEVLRCMADSDESWRVRAVAAETLGKDYHRT